MSNEKKIEFEPFKVGTIPDFFHDIIGYIIPGFTAILLFVVNLYVVGQCSLKELLSLLKDTSVIWSLLSLIAAYVIGRFFEQLGRSLIHDREFRLSWKFFPRVPSPKWSLLFDNSNSKYTAPFKKNLIVKIKRWLKNQSGDDLVTTCEQDQKDDYFNLIQFYLRERFPSVALYEKKQNANIVLTRSLTLIFAVNILLYLSIPLYASIDMHTLFFSWCATLWLVANGCFCWVLYKRFRLDKGYHAQYILETFIATKGLLSNAKPSDTDSKKNKSHNGA